MNESPTSINQLSPVMAHEALTYRAEQLVSTPEPFQAAAHQAGAFTVAADAGWFQTFQTFHT
jgi:hypothetical protein